MSKLNLSLICMAFVALSVGAASGGATGTSGSTRFVSTAGADTGGCTALPCLTIGYAAGQASDGDTVSVAAGTYKEQVTLTKRLDLVGNSATIDADGFDNGVVVSGAGASGSKVRGLTIKNAGLEGIFALQTSRLTIGGNTVVENDKYGIFSPQCVNQPDDCGEAVHLQSVTNSKVIDNLVRDNVGGILLTDENGPTSGNTIAGNRVLDNAEDCGITLASHYFQLGSPVAAGVGGVYLNQVLHNVSNGNGAAGVGVFAGPPGAAAWGNLVLGNTALNNGLPGVAIHSHQPFQNANGNVVLGNNLGGNGPDDDAQTGQSAGIVVFSDAAAGATPIQHTVIAGNSITNEHFGIFTLNAVKTFGLPINHIDGSVAVPLSIH